MSRRRTDKAPSGKNKKSLTPRRRAAQQGELARLNAIVGPLRAKLEAAEATIAAHETTIEKRNTTIAELNSQIDALEEQIAKDAPEVSG